MLKSDMPDLNKLDWQLLQGRLASACHTEDAAAQASALYPNLERSGIERSWQETDDLCQLLIAGYHVPPCELPNLEVIFRTARVSAMLAADQLQQVQRLLLGVQALSSFANGLASKSALMAKTRQQLDPLPKLLRKLQATLEDDGTIKDSASPLLGEIRSGKRKLRQRIEKQLTELMTYGHIVPYLQDNYFTQRHDRYVLPLKLDSRGRIRGRTIDTSESGQSLFFEPNEISKENDQLLEMELAEKLEVIRILRDLSLDVTKDLPILSDNYRWLVHIDFTNAKAVLARQMNAIAISISEQPKLQLLEARHPLLNVAADQQVPNDILVLPEQRVLLITGPNAGGKTVVLKTVGLLHLMAKAGLLLPCHADSQLFLFDNIYMELGDSQDLSANLSTFSSHIAALVPILHRASGKDLVLFDELAVGTEPLTGEAIAQSILEELGKRKTHVVVTSHFDRLKTLAFTNPSFRNGAMEFSNQNYRPTYKLLLDVPGNSYGLEMAANFGMPSDILARAKQLRGSESVNFDKAVESLTAEKSHYEQLRLELHKLQKDAEQSKYHWEQQREQIAARRQQIEAEVKEKTAQRLRPLEEDYHRRLEELDLTIKSLANPAATAVGIDEQRDAAKQVRSRGGSDLKSLRAQIAELNQRADKSPLLMGQALDLTALKRGQKVYIVPLQQLGELKEFDLHQSTGEVQTGQIKLKVALRDLRSAPDSPPANPSFARAKPRSGANDGNRSLSIGNSSSQEIPFLMPTSNNTLDLRGQRVDEALAATWAFLDQAMLKGTGSILILHGHGNGDLKRAVRYALEHECPYPIRFRVGSQGEGGDGVTVIQLT
jgi:DNA mismatch repair protein MutS2